jgi:4-coumarate--CoA ligase
MHFKSKIPDLVIPKCSILDYLFPPGTEPSEKPLWINAKDESISNSPKSALLYARRLGFGLKRLGVKSGDVCMLFTPNHIFVPVAYWGVVGLGAAFSGANPNFTVKGMRVGRDWVDVRGIANGGGGIELEYQIAILQPKVLLVHPSLLETGKKAAKKAGLRENQLYLFADLEAPSVGEVRDWRTILGTPEEGSKWQWKKLSPEEAQTQVAAINFSSG